MTRQILLLEIRSNRVQLVVFLRIPKPVYQSQLIKEEIGRGKRTGQFDTKETRARVRVK